MHASPGDDWGEGSELEAEDRGGGSPPSLTAEDHLALARAPRVATASRIPLRGSQAVGPVPVAAKAPDAFGEGPYVRGADGKLHGAPGQTITGPFDFGRWSHNIDWGGVAHDLALIGSRALALGGAPGLSSRLGVTGVAGQGLTGADAATLGGGLYATGEETLQASPRPRRSR